MPNGPPWFGLDQEPGHPVRVQSPFRSHKLRLVGNEIATDVPEPAYGEPSTAPGSPDQPINSSAIDGTEQDAAAFSNQPNRSMGATQMGNLLYYAVVFLIVALVAAAFGFGGLAGTAVEGAKILFWIAIVLFGIAAVAGVMRRN
jgi:uncharacterized membrane protein YtjA (UPF0391 family)